MLARVQLTLAAGLLMLALVLGGVLLFGRHASADGGAGYTVGPEGFAGSVAPPGLPARDFTLSDQDGKRISLAALRGHVTVLTFLYSHCQDTCPVTASTILGALDDLPDHGHDVPALAVSVDPANDTPESARAFLLARRVTGRMDFLLGSRPQLARVWNAYHVQPQGTAGNAKAFDHSTYVLVIDKRGIQRSSFPESELNAAGLAHDIRKLEAEPA